jgi:hypothetical protein
MYIRRPLLLRGHAAAGSFSKGLNAGAPSVHATCTHNKVSTYRANHSHRRCQSLNSLAPTVLNFGTDGAKLAARNKLHGHPPRQTFAPTAPLF